MGDCAQGEKNGRAVDRRVRRSRRAMMGAFDRLIMTTPFEQISVSAVAREADVDRKTVYQHFGGVDGILDAIVEEAVSELLDEVEETMRGRVGAGEDVRPLSAFFDALSVHLGKNAVLWQRYCEHVPTELLFDHLARPPDRRARPRARRALGHGAGDAARIRRRRPALAVPLVAAVGPQRTARGGDAPRRRPPRGRRVTAPPLSRPGRAPGLTSPFRPDRASRRITPREGRRTSAGSVWANATGRARGRRGRPRHAMRRSRSQPASTRAWLQRSSRAA